ncbi:tetratricopeptide repeat protein 28-like isoform X1 [Sycon ciliatum]|uniref:tetratricopeptide repeat protein 28-like isoform X1 n=2 Tax=Sycon ciliatum TaxID=27933 RepID=UPI0031F6E844
MQEDKRTARTMSFNKAQWDFLKRTQAAAAAKEEAEMYEQPANFEQAVERYTEAISLDRGNAQLFCSRSAAFVKVEKFQEALADAERAIELQPNWAKAFLRQGQALQSLQHYERAMVAFSHGLMYEPANTLLLNALKDVTMLSPLKATFGPILSRFEHMGLADNTFIITSIIGQEMNTAGSSQTALPILKAAEAVGTDNNKLMLALQAALGTAYWRSGDHNNALRHMTRSMDMAREREDRPAQCRAHGSLGSAYMSLGDHRLATSHFEQQHTLAVELDDGPSAVSALSNLGLLRSSQSDHRGALVCHKKAHTVAKNLGDEPLLQAQQLGHMGTCYQQLGDYEKAVTCHQKHLHLAQRLKLPAEQCKACEKLSLAYSSNLNFSAAMASYKQLLTLGVETRDLSVQAAGYGGLAQVCRSTGDNERALSCHSEQFKLVKQLSDVHTEAAILTSMGTLCYQLSRYNQALAYHREHLAIVKELGDRVAEGCAYGNLGIVHKALGNNAEAIKFHLLELAIASEVGDRSSEASTHGNLGIAYQAVGDHELAAKHFHLHLRMAEDLGDVLAQCRALNNLGQHCMTGGQHAKGVPYLESCLKLSVQLKDRACEFRACNHLGQAHLALENHDKAIMYFERVFDLSKALQDKAGMGRACSRLGDVFKAIGDVEKAETYHKQLFALSQQLSHAVGQCTALTNLGELALASGKLDLAADYYRQLQTVAEREKQASFEAISHSGQAAVCREKGNFTQALEHYECTLTACQESSDKRGMAKALGHMGDSWLAIGDFAKASEHYQQQLTLANDLQDALMECLVYRSLGLAHSKVGEYSMAAEFNKRQVSVASGLPSHQQIEAGRAWANLGEAYECLFRYSDAVPCYDKLLSIASMCSDDVEKMRAHAGLGRCHRELGNTDEAMAAFEQRLQMAQALRDVVAEVECYADLGQVQKSLGDYTRAVEYHQRQLVSAQTMADLERQGQAMCDLGEVYQEMGQFEQAAMYHRNDLKIAEELGHLDAQMRAAANLGTAYFALRQFDAALSYHRRQLSIAAQLGEEETQASAYNALGMCYIDMKQPAEALQHLQNGLKASAHLQVTGLQAELRMNLGLALHMSGKQSEAKRQLETAIALFERTAQAIIEKASSSGQLRLVVHYQQLSLETLQQVLVSLGDNHNALAVAEQCRIKAHQHILLERQVQIPTLVKAGFIHPQDMTFADLQGLVRGLGSCVLYYSIAGTSLYAWLLSPDGRVQKFHSTKLQQDLHRFGVSQRALESSGQATATNSTSGSPSQAEFAAGLGTNGETNSNAMSSSELPILERLVADARTITLEGGSSGSAASRPGSGQSSGSTSATTSPRDTAAAAAQAVDMSSVSSGDTSPFKRQSSDESTMFTRRRSASVKVGSASPKTSITRNKLRSVNETLNTDGQSYLLSPSPPAGGGLLGDPNGRSNVPAPLQALYELLLLPMEDVFADILSSRNTGGVSVTPQLYVVIHDCLHLVPFALLRADEKSDFLHRRFNLIGMPFLGYLRHDFGTAHLQRVKERGSSRGAAIVDGGYPASRLDTRRASGSSPSSFSTGHHSDRTQRASGGQSGSSSTSVSSSHHSTPPPPPATTTASSAASNLSTSHGSGGGGGGGGNSSGGHYTSTASSGGGGSGSGGGGGSNKNYLVMSNPAVSNVFRDMYSWHALPAGDAETGTVAEILGTHALTGAMATKQRFLKMAPGSRLVHLCTHVSWKLSTFVLGARPVPSSGRGAVRDASDGDDSSGTDSAAQLGDDRIADLSELLLTPVDVLQMKLASVRVVVLGGCHSTGLGQISADGMMALCTSFLASGVSCVVMPLWPISPQAGKLFMAAFYNSLLRGSRASRALGYAMHKVQTSRRHWHPVNWSGFVLFGRDTVLYNQSPRLAEDLRHVLHTEEDGGRGAFYVLRHLVKRALTRLDGSATSPSKPVVSWSSVKQRVNKGPPTSPTGGGGGSLSTSVCSVADESSLQSGIERLDLTSDNGPVHNDTTSGVTAGQECWCRVLRTCGFHVQPPTPEYPAGAIVLPEHDDSRLLKKCFLQMDAFLVLSSGMQLALSRMSCTPTASQHLQVMLQQSADYLHQRAAVAENSSAGGSGRRSSSPPVHAPPPQLHPPSLSVPTWVLQHAGVSEVLDQLGLLIHSATEQATGFSIAAAADRRVLHAAAQIFAFVFAHEGSGAGRKSSSGGRAVTSC